MSFLRRAAGGIRALVQRDVVDRELDEELRDYIARTEDAYRGAGMPPAEAARRARVEVGSVPAVKDEVRAGFWEATVDAFLRDVKYGARQLWHRPAFSLGAMLTIALGIGVNVTVFSALNAVALRPLPIAHGDRAVRIARWFDNTTRGSGQYFFSYPEYLYLRDGNDAFAELVAVSPSLRVPISSSSDISGDASAEPVLVQFVSENFFSGLGVKAARGRTFQADELSVPGGQSLVVLSDSFWRRRFNGDPNVLGMTLVLNRAALTIVGVMPPTFIGVGNPPEMPDVWSPLSLQPSLMPEADWMTQPALRRLQLVGILAPEATLGAANGRLSGLATSLDQLVNAAAARTDRTRTLRGEYARCFGETNDIRFSLFVAALMIVVGLILATACANLANMLLARGSGRGREIAVRLALGASRWRIVRQLLTESLILSLGGSLLAFAGSLTTARLLWVRIEETVQTLAGGRGQFTVDLSPDVRVFAYTMALALLATVAFGLWPALQASRVDINSAAKDGSIQSTGCDRSGPRGLLTSAQVAVSITLLITAGLLTRGVALSSAVNPGFDTTRVYLASFAQNPDAPRAAALKSALLRRLGDAPEVNATALVDRVPLSGTWSPAIRVEDAPATAPRGSLRSTLANSVSSGFFDTMGIPIVRGRNFTTDETATGAPVAVISESAAHAFWPAADPIGRRVQLDLKFTGAWTSLTVIGVAGDVRSANLSRIDPSFVYLATNATDRYSVLIRSNLSAPAVKPAVAGALAALSPSAAPTLSLVELEQFARVQRILPEAVATCAMLLGLIALVLAAAGIYSVVSILVTRRAREIGIRIAIGATARDAVLLIVRQSLRPVALGMAVGLVVSSALSGLLRAMLAVSPSSPDLLFGVGAFDPWTFGGLTIFVAAIAFLAAALPARRAAAVDPVVALRAD